VPDRSKELQLRASQMDYCLVAMEEGLHSSWQESQPVTAKTGPSQDDVADAPVDATDFEVEDHSRTVAAEKDVVWPKVPVNDASWQMSCRGGPASAPRGSEPPGGRSTGCQVARSQSPGVAPRSAARPVGLATEITR
jgi:hypothetical protein